EIARRHLPLIKLFHYSAEVSPGVGHALLDGCFHFRRELAGIEGLARADADLGETRHECFLGRDRRAELQVEVQDVEELQRGLFFCWRQRPDEINGRCGLGCRLAEKRRERLYLIASLDLPHIVDIRRIEELRAIRWERQFGLTAKDLLDALGRLAFPARPSEQEAAASVAARACADV